MKFGYLLLTLLDLLDLITAGNLFGAEPETARYDPGIGMVSIGLGDGKFQVGSLEESGLYVPGNVKDLTLINAGNNGIGLLAANNNNRLQTLVVNDVPENKSENLNYLKN